MKRLIFSFILLGCITTTRVCFGLAEERVGPVDNATAQPGWPDGIAELLRHQSRAYSIWVNGNENFYYQADGKQINELIKHFSKMRLRDHAVAIKAGRPIAKTFKGVEISYNVNFHVLSGIALAMHKRGDSPETFEPTLTIYVDPEEDTALVKQISLPDNIVLNNEVKSFPLMGGATKPKRQTWHAHIQFEDGKPAADFEIGISTVVTLWEKDVKQGIQLGKVNHLGYFHAAFSEAEIADLKEGKNWLTMTVGNWLTKASRDDPKLDAQKLGLESEEVPIVKLNRPSHSLVAYRLRFKPTGFCAFICCQLCLRILFWKSHEPPHKTIRNRGQAVQWWREITSLVNFSSGIAANSSQGKCGELVKADAGPHPLGRLFVVVASSRHELGKILCGG